jgi:hypothetical protein
VRSTIICFFVLIIFLSGNTGASEVARVQLIDGSVISGKIISFKEGVYTLGSASLGTITIDESQIQLIRMDSSGTDLWVPVGTSNDSIERTMQSLQKSITNDPQMMELIRTLQNDPEIEALIQDEAIRDALSTGDINSLMANPEFIKIFENPSIQQIQKEIIK